MIVYFNNQFRPEEEVRLPISDRGFLFGDGVYATVRVEEGRAIFYEEHIARLEEQAKTLQIECESPEYGVIEHLIEQNGAQKGVWRLKVIVTGGTEFNYSLAPRKGNVLVTLNPYQREEQRPLSLGIFSHPVSICHASFKSLAHLNRWYVMAEAQKRGWDDCVTLTEQGVVLEAAFGNLFWVEEETVSTPSPELPLYFGVTISKVLDIAEELGYRIQYVASTVDQLPEQAAYFRVNTLGEICPIGSIGGMDGLYDVELTRRFQKAYAQKKAAPLSAAH